MSIKALVKEFKVPPGSVLSAATLASELLVSVTPVREALIRLADQGYIDFASHKGFSVIRPSLHYYQTRYEMIDALTCCAIRTIVVDQDTDGLEQLCSYADTELSRIPDRESADDRIALIEALLSAIAAESHNDLLSRCLVQSIEQTSYLRRIILSDEEFLQLQIERIRNCFHALRCRDECEACAIVRQALASVTTMLPGAVESLVIETFRKNGSVL